MAVLCIRRPMDSPRIIPAAFACIAFACIAAAAAAQNPPAADAQTLIDQCRSAGQLASADCARAVERKLALAQSPCPEKIATKACRSFQELLRDDDTGIMADLARQDHVYVCFLPSIDEFFKVSYSEPPSSAFAKASPAQVKQGMPPSAWIALGATEFDYFRSGVRDSDSSIHDSGNWIELPPLPPDPRSPPQNAEVRQTRFQGKSIEITSDEWKLTETYPNDTGARTRHTVTLQLATGRFRQEFALADSGKIQAQNSGRCLIAPSLPDP